jgi:polar amino acid transport system substrate-binding protein
MDLSHRHTFLTSGWLVRLCMLIMGLTLQGCGLILDAIQLIKPLTADELGAICTRNKVHVGMAVEPVRPFVFPAIFTDEGLRVTGMDVELVREIAAALSKKCGGQPIVPVLHLVRFRDLFVELSEGKLDLFVSAVSADLPSPARAGLAYSMPYFYNGGIAGIARRADVIERVRMHTDRPPETSAASIPEELAGLAVAVQEGTGAHLYAQTYLPQSQLVLCDSLPAAFESQDPTIDVILGKQPVLQFMVTRVRKDWRQLIGGNGKPLLLTREHYAVVMAEESYRLRSLVNDILFRLDESGRLDAMRHRWLEDQYAYPRRAAREGLPFSAEDMPQHYDQGGCRWTGR